jgi:hypothetical protein
MQIDIKEMEVISMTNKATVKKDKKDNSKTCMILWFAGAFIWLLSAGISLYGTASGYGFNGFVITQIGMAIFSIGLGIDNLVKYRKNSK